MLKSICFSGFKQTQNSSFKDIMNFQQKVASPRICSVLFVQHQDLKSEQVKSMHLRQDLHDIEVSLKSVKHILVNKS